MLLLSVVRLKAAKSMFAYTALARAVVKALRILSHHSYSQITYTAG